MEPTSLVFATITAFKEVFLLSRVIYRAAISGKHVLAERSDLHQEFYRELLFLRDFGVRFLQNPSENLDKVSRCPSVVRC